VPRFAPADVHDAAHLQGSIPVGSLAGAAAAHSSQASSSYATSLLYQSQVSLQSPQQEPIISERPSAYPNLLDEDSPETPSSVPPQNLSMLPPPRPPNPETLHLHAEVHHKLMSELGSLSEALATDAERLRAHQTDLLNGEPAIRDEMARLEAVRAVCSTVAGRVKGMVNQAETNIAELRRKGDPEVDELICSTTIVHNQ
jgi:ESCRT-I complex subunit TSG101